MSDLASHVRNVITAHLKAAGFATRRLQFEELVDVPLAPPVRTLVRSRDGDLFVLTIERVVKEESGSRRIW